MLKGYMVPRSPLGQASIDPPPPWHYSGDVLAVEFWADPAATTSMLPDGLSPDPSTNGHAFAMFVDAESRGASQTFASHPRASSRSYANFSAPYRRQRKNTVHSPMHATALKPPSHRKA